MAIKYFRKMSNYVQNIIRSQKLLLSTPRRTVPCNHLTPSITCFILRGINRVPRVGCRHFWDSNHAMLPDFIEVNVADKLTTMAMVQGQVKIAMESNSGRIPAHTVSTTNIWFRVWVYSLSYLKIEKNIYWTNALNFWVMLMIEDLEKLL